MRICQYCGSEFDDPEKDYCSQNCLSKACGFSIYTKKCETCGKEFESLIDAIYCSFECTYNLQDGVEVSLPKKH